MTRRDWTPERLREIAARVSEVAAIVNRVAGEVQDAGLPSLFTHADKAVFQWLPSLENWASAIDTDRDSQILAFQLGLKSRAKEMAEQASAQKEKKPKQRRSKG